MATRDPTVLRMLGRAAVGGGPEGAPQEQRPGSEDHDGVPIFIVARHEPGVDISLWPLVTYVNDVTTAMSKAKEAAGDKNVLVHGAGVAQLALAARVLDELELHVVPVLFGQGRRLFDGLAAKQIELERIRILEGEGGVTHMHYQVRADV